VRGELAELGADDLRLDLDEVRAILAAQGSTDAATAERVLAMSGGWAAAVRLATAALPVAGSDAAATDGASTDAFHDELWRYLADEVLQEQTPELRAFLLETSILDELRVETCAAVTGHPDAAGVLRELEARRLFVARFSRPDGPMWRYHDLFAAFLRDRLLRERDPAAVAELHRRAATALPPVAAIPHLVAAGDPKGAADRIAEAMFTTFDGSLFPHVLPWIDRLPPELVKRDPRLTMIHAWYLDLGGRSFEARAAVEPLWRRLVAEGRHDEAVDVGIQLVGSLLSAGDLDAVDEVLAQVDPLDLDAPRRIIVLMSRIWRDWNRRDTAAMSAGFERALHLALQAGTAGANVMAPGLTSPLLFLDRGPSWLLDRSIELEANLVPHDDTVRLQLRTLRAAAALLRVDTGGVEAELRSVLAASVALGRIAWTHQDTESLLLMLLLAKGERDAVVAQVDAALEARPTSPIFDRWWPAYAYPALRASLPARSRRALRALVARYLPDELRDTSPNDAVVRGMAEAWLALAGGAAPDAREPLSALEEAERLQHAARAYLGTGMPGLERGSLLLAVGRATAALDAAEPTLDVATRFGAGILLSEVEPHRPLLTRCAEAGLAPDLIGAAFAAVDAAHESGRTLEIPGSGERLTAREVDVLRLVADGRTNREIAEALGISEATVKTHMTRVLSKLGASSRTRAVARARELYLV
jgi:LuxR family transcriptional regulator, maltose regulon positive regulatory protein